MMWHTSLILKLSNPIRKIFLLALLSLFLLGTGAYSCGGSGTGGGSPGGVGGVGGAGAPPVSIPGPEALNMHGITISPPDSAGSVTVTGTPGAALANADVRVRNIGPQVSWYKKAVMNVAYAAVGDEVLVKANADGSFSAQIKAVIGDRLALAQKVALKSAFSVEIMGTVQNVISQPTGLVPANEQKPFLKSNMKVGPGGETWFIQSTSSKKWKWLDLFVSTAYAEDLVVQNVLEMNCPSQMSGPCSSRTSTIPHEGYCPLTKSDSNGNDQGFTLQIPYCRDLNGIEPAQIKGPPEQNFLAIAAGKNGIILKDMGADKWVVSDVLRFNVPLKGVQSDYQPNDLVFYFSTSQGFYSYSTKTRAVAFYATKVGLTSSQATALAKKGSHLFYTIWKDNRASLFQGNVSDDPNFNFQKELPLNINRPVTTMIVLQADTDKKISLQKGDLFYKAIELVFAAGKTIYFMEIPTIASYNNLYAAMPANPDLDLARLEKIVAIDFPEASRDFTQLADNPDQTIVAALEGEKIHLIDYTFGENIALQAMKINRVIDANGVGNGASLVYNPISRNFMLRGLTENVSLGSGQTTSSSNSQSRGMMLLPVTDRNLPEASSRMVPRESPTSRDGLEVQVRQVPGRSTSPSNSATGTNRTLIPSSR